MRSRRLAALIIVVLAVTSACSTASAKKVAPHDLEQQVANQLNTQKLVPTNIVCPKALDAKVGATASCIVAANSLQYTANVKATSVKGSKVAFKLTVPGPAVIPTQTLEAQVTSVLTKREPATFKSATCAKPLDGVKGKTATCSVTSKNGKTRDVTVKVTQATLLNVALDVLEK
ncbi:MAG: hypothetical protein JWR83_1746 [Aeromicrobium sp.]|nr:hypothetical protein [Aeromicrobium sp.]